MRRSAVAWPSRGAVAEAILWAGAFAAAIAAHVAVGWLLLPRISGPAGLAPDPSVVTIDLSSSDAAAAPAPSEEARPSAAPEPVLEPRPDVPDATVPPPVAEAPDTPAPVAIELPEPALPPAAIVPPRPAVILPPPPKIVPRPAPSRPVVPRVQLPAARPVQASERGERRAEPRPPSAPARNVGPGAASGGAAAANSAAWNSAAWRSQLNAYLRSRMRVPGGAGRSIGISFSVGRSGQITSARLSRSSGDAAIDGAALAVFRGMVPPPPSDYTGPLAFTTMVRIQ